MKTLTVRSADGRAIGVYRAIDRFGDPILAFRDEVRVVRSRADARALNGELLCMSRLCRIQRLAIDGRWYECTQPEHIVTTAAVAQDATRAADVADHDRNSPALRAIVTNTLAQHFPEGMINVKNPI